MKHRVLSLGLLLCFVCLMTAALAKATSTLTITKSTQTELEFNFSLPKLEINDLTGVSTGYKEIRAAGAEYLADNGMPCLPFYSYFLAIPGTGSVRVSSEQEITKQLYDMRPVAVQPDAPGGTGTMTLSPDYFRSGSLYPQQLYQVSAPAIIRDFRVVRVNIYPLQWQGDTQNIKVTEAVKLKLTFTPEPGENELPGFDGTYSPVFTPLYESVIDNFDQYRRDDLAPRNPRILMIYGANTDTSFQNKLTEFVTWKQQKGYLVSAVSTTTAGGASTTAIKAYIQQQYNNASTRPDFVILIGDTTGSFIIPTWTESWSSYAGVGDYPYVKLAGNDELGDAFIGRISIETTTHFDILLAKIYAVEKNINLSAGQTAWLNKMLIVGDPSSSGVSTIYNAKFIKEISKAVNPDYTYTEVYSNPFASAMNTAINNGISYMSYRGYIGMSGWSPSDANLTNGTKLPHTVIITCGTGNFSGTATTESFIRLGTAAVPKGAATAIGMATSGTHTMFNNTLSGAIANAVFGFGMRTMGEAMLSGKLYLESVYGVSNSSQAHYFAHWCNLMGDPTLEVWTGIPKSFSINVPATVPTGIRQLEFTAVDYDSQPVGSASITAYCPSTGMVASGFTNADGSIILSLPETISGTLIITVAKKNFKPLQQTITLNAQGAMNANSVTVDDNSSGASVGNGNGTINAGETIELAIPLRNSSALNYSSISATLSTDNTHISIISPTVQYGAISAGQTQANTTPYVISISNALATEEEIRLTLAVSDLTGDNWTTSYRVFGYNINLVPSQVTITGGSNAVLDPGETANLSITLTNSGSLHASGISGLLTSLNDLVQVQTAQSQFGDIAIGGTGTCQTNFVLFGRPQLVPGMQIPMQLQLTNAEGYFQLQSFNLNIGIPSQHTPLGPDAHGYLIYDMTDTAFPECPDYNWIEIAPAGGGSGTSLGLSDAGTSGDEGDQETSNKIATVTLPFTFRFYGQDYTQISVCANGFITMGVTENAEFRNYRLPGALGPGPMIAAFWDDLIIPTGGGVYKYYDTSQHYLIVEYYQLKNGYNRTSEETFQVILYDPAFYPTGTGDGMIKIQYKVFNNVDIGSSGYSPSHGNYSTIGIKDYSNRIGLEYTYNNSYPATCASLSSQKSILITTVPVLQVSPLVVVSETYVWESNHNNVIEPGETVELGLQLTNQGMDTATNVVLQVNTTDQYIVPVNMTSTYSNITGSSSVLNNVPIRFQVAGDCPDNHVVNLTCNIQIDGHTWDRNISVIVRKPDLAFNGFIVNDIWGNGNGIPEPGEQFKLAVMLSNPSLVETRNVTAVLTSTNPNVTIANPQANYYYIPAGMTIQHAFDVTFGNAVPTGSYVPFSITYMATGIPENANTFNVACATTGYSQDFEQDDGGFISSDPSGWDWGIDTTAGAHSPTHVWGTCLGQQYPVNANYTLTTPSLSIGDNATMSFWHYYQMESNYDGGNVKISTDGGQNWNLLMPVGNYPSTNVPALSEAGYTGTQSTWLQAQFNLSNYANQNIKLRWTFASDDMINGRGWYIDDLTIIGVFSNSGMISGTIGFSGSNPNFAQAVLSTNSGYATHPNPDGSYALYVPFGMHNLSLQMPGCLTESFNNVQINAANYIINHDFFLNYLPPLSNVMISGDDPDYTISWNAPLNPTYPVQSYKVYKRCNASAFALLTETTQPSLSQTLPLGSFNYFVVVNYGMGLSMPSDTLSFNTPYVAAQDGQQTPLVTQLQGNYPNPFNPSTTIVFSLKQPGKVRLSIYNTKGQLVRTLCDSGMQAGKHQIVWNGKSDNGMPAGSGVYLYRLETGRYHKTLKAILLK